MSASEIRKLETYFKPKAKASQQSGYLKRNTLGSPEPKVTQDETARTRDQVGVALGVSGPTYRARHVALLHPQDAEELTRGLRVEVAARLGVLRESSSLGRGFR